MRAQEFINEIENIGSLSGAEWLPTKSLRGTKPIPGKTDLSYKVVKTSVQSGPTVYVYAPKISKDRPIKKNWENNKDFEKRIQYWEQNKTGRVVGALETMAQNTFPIKGAVQVSTITVDPKFQGQGLAQFMYDVVVNELKLPLVAGSSQTPESQRAWLTLSKNPNINVTGYVVVGEEDINENPQLIDKIMELGGQKLGRYKTKWGYYYYFIFPLKFGRKRLNPVVLNKLSQIYGDDSFVTGMYAVGTRR